MDRNSNFYNWEYPYLVSDAPPARPEPTYAQPQGTRQWPTSQGHQLQAQGPHHNDMSVQYQTQPGASAFSSSSAAHNMTFQNQRPHRASTSAMAYPGMAGLYQAPSDTRASQMAYQHPAAQDTPAYGVHAPARDYSSRPAQHLASVTHAPQMGYPSMEAPYPPRQDAYASHMASQSPYAAYPPPTAYPSMAPRTNYQANQQVMNGMTYQSSGTRPAVYQTNSTVDPRSAAPSSYPIHLPAMGQPSGSLPRQAARPQPRAQPLTISAARGLLSAANAANAANPNTATLGSPFVAVAAPHDLRTDAPRSRRQQPTIVDVDAVTQGLIIDLTDETEERSSSVPPAEVSTPAEQAPPAAQVSPPSSPPPEITPTADNKVSAEARAALNKPRNYKWLRSYNVQPEQANPKKSVMSTLERQERDDAAQAAANAALRLFTNQGICEQEKSTPAPDIDIHALMAADKKMAAERRKRKRSGMASEVSDSAPLTKREEAQARLKATKRKWNGKKPVEPKVNTGRQAKQPTASDEPPRKKAKTAKKAGKRAEVSLDSVVEDDDEDFVLGAFLQAETEEAQVEAPEEDEEEDFLFDALVAAEEGEQQEKAAEEESARAACLMNKGPENATVEAGDGTGEKGQEGETPVEENDDVTRGDEDNDSLFGDDEPGPVEKGEEEMAGDVTRRDEEDDDDSLFGDDVEPDPVEGCEAKKGGNSLARDEGAQYLPWYEEREDMGGGEEFIIVYPDGKPKPREKRAFDWSRAR